MTQKPSNYDKLTGVQRAIVYGPERLPRFSRPYGYDRQYRGPMTDPGVYSDEQRRFNRERREYERFRSYQRGPYNPY